MRKMRSAKKPDDGEGRGAAREGPAIEERAEKDGEKARFEQLRFPAVAIPILPDVDERHVENPEEREQEARSRNRRATTQESAKPTQAVATSVASEWSIQKSEGKRRKPPNEPPSTSRHVGYSCQAGEVRRSR